MESTNARALGAQVLWVFWFLAWDEFVELARAY